jgi:hypothetical protein
MDSTAQVEQIALTGSTLGSWARLAEDIPEVEIVPVAEERLSGNHLQNHPLAHKSRKAIPLKPWPLNVSARFASERSVFNPWIILLCQRAGFRPLVVQESGNRSPS